MPRSTLSLLIDSLHPATDRRMSRALFGDAANVQGFGPSGKISSKEFGNGES
jgi:hypothetical protein